ncbi:MAG: hypothetical protein VX475_22000 [Myxococcota bacterium]|nr:hypothetical protein [Myxococcota bacterium]
MLRLYHGDASVVELLSEGERAALAIETPLLRFVRDVALAPEVAHVFLTGNAGDGKTFTALQAFKPRPGFCVVHDASAFYGAGGDPVDALARHLSDALTRHEKIFMSINRGMLERLYNKTQESYAGPLRELLISAYEQLRLDVSWGPECASVSVIDLGLLDTLSPPVLGLVLEKVRATRPLEELSAPSRESLSAALAALHDTQVSARLLRGLALVRGAGHHVTMRQLWSLFSYIVTGGRAPADETPLTLGDALGARLFSDEAQGALFELLRAVDDPSLTPQAELDLAALVDPTLPRQLASCPGLSFITAEVDLSGLALKRAAAIHQWPRANDPPKPKPLYDRLVESLRALGEGWKGGGSLPIELLIQGMYRGLGLWSSRGVYPVWQRLCYDSRRLEAATSLANSELELEKLRLGLPRPNPAAQRALEGCWTPPHVWMIYDQEEPRLRLTPRLVEVLAALGSGREAFTLTEPERLHIWRWLSQIGDRAKPAGGHVKLFHPSAETPKELTRTWATGQLSID